MADSGTKLGGGTATLTEMTAEIASAYVKNNSLIADKLPELLKTIYTSLTELDRGSASADLHPAVSIRRSITPDYLICLEDGQKKKMLKRYLRRAYALTPEEYRAKWKLPLDYPMTAPNYAAKRSQLAKKIGLGRKSHRRRKR